MHPTPPREKKEAFLQKHIWIKWVAEIKDLAEPGKFKQASAAHSSLPVNTADWDEIKESGIADKLPFFTVVDIII